MSSYTQTKEALMPLIRQAEKARKPYRFIETLNIFLGRFIFLSGLLLMVVVLVFTDTYDTLMPKLLSILSLLDSSSPYLLSVLLIYAFIVIIFKSQYRRKEGILLRAFLEKMIPDFIFNPSNSINLQTIQNSGLFLLKNKKTNPKTVISNGNLYGKIDGIGLTIFGLKITGLSKFHNILSYIPFLWILVVMAKPLFIKNINQIGVVFMGMFVIAKFNKKIKGRTVVLPGTVEKRVGYLAKTLQSLHFKRNQLVNMEDSEFEKQFLVYSTDQTEARYILTPFLMKRISALQKKIAHPIRLSFKEDNVHMAVEHPNGFLSLSKNKNLVTSNALEDIYHGISTAICIVEDLNLNTKIWG